MQKMISAYLPGDKAVEKMKLEDFALLLWEKTIDGRLYMPERDYAVREKEKEMSYLCCHMDWSREQALTLARDVKTMAKALEKQAALERAEGETPPPAFFPQAYGKPEIMGKYFQAVFFPIAGFERDLDNMVSRLIYMEKFPRARRMEETIRKRRSAGTQKGPEAWRGPLPAGMEAMRFWSQSEGKTQLIIQAKWLYRLFLFEAPKHMIQARLRELYRFTALDLFGKGTRRSRIYRGLGFPLWDIKNTERIRKWFLEDYCDGGIIVPNNREWEWDYDALDSMDAIQDLFLFHRSRHGMGGGDPEESLQDKMTACRELNPLGLTFLVNDEGLETGRAVVLCMEEADAAWDDRPPRSPEEIRQAVEAFARDFGVDEALIDIYETEE